MTNSFLIRRRAFRMLVFVLASIVASSGVGFASVIGTFDRSFQVNGPVDLEVLTRSGDITVRNGGAGTVSIHAKIHSGNSWFGGDHKQEVQELQNNPPIRQTGNSIRIDYVNLNNISIDYEITVPENTAVRAHTGSGDQTVEGLKGNIDLQSGSGDLRLARLTGELRFQTGSGRTPRFVPILAAAIRLSKASRATSIFRAGRAICDWRASPANCVSRRARGTSVDGSFLVRRTSKQAAVTSKSRK